MKLLAAILFVASAALGGFAWWGTQTPAGRRRYDEMDGLYPLGAGVGGGVLLVAAIVLGAIAWTRSR